MDPRHTGEVLKHLEKQEEILAEAHKSMTNELMKLKVEQEMLMRKCYEVWTAQGKNKKKQDTRNVSDGNASGQTMALSPSSGNNEQN